MLHLPTTNELEYLTSFKEPLCLSIYMPLIDPNTATNPNRIELKNALRESEIALSSAGLSVKEVKKMLRPAYKLLDEYEFWPIRKGSLVLFIHPKLFRYYNVYDRNLPYQLTVETGFNLEPLLQVIRNNLKYYVLAIGHKNVRLFEGDLYDIKPVELKHFPADMKETLRIDEFPKSQETHTIAPASSGKGSEAFHEQYNVAQTDKNMLVEFFRQVDRNLHKFLFFHQRPLLIAGVKYLIPIYQKVNTYPGLVSAAITGNQDVVDLRVLRDKAVSIVAGT